MQMATRSSALLQLAAEKRVGVSQGLQVEQPGIGGVGWLKPSLAENGIG